MYILYIHRCYVWIYIYCIYYVCILSVYTLCTLLYTHYVHIIHIHYVYTRYHRRHSTDLRIIRWWWHQRAGAHLLCWYPSSPATKWLWGLGCSSCLSCLKFAVGWLLSETARWLWDPFGARTTAMKMTDLANVTPSVQSPGILPLALFEEASSFLKDRLFTTYSPQSS